MNVGLRGGGLAVPFFGLLAPNSFHRDASSDAILGGAMLGALSVTKAVRKGRETGTNNTMSNQIV